MAGGKRRMHIDEIGFLYGSDKISTLGENIEVNLVFLTRFFISPSKSHKHL